MDRRIVQEKEAAMKRVNLYIGITAHGPRRQHGAFGWVLELIRDDGTASPHTRNGFGVREDTNDRELTLEALAEALDRFTEPCEINIIFSQKYMAETFPTAWLNGWVDKWKANGWKNSKGQEIARADIWERAEAALCKHQAFFCPPSTHNSFAVWITEEAERRTRKFLEEKEGTTK